MAKKKITAEKAVAKKVAAKKAPAKKVIKKKSVSPKKRNKNKQSIKNIKRIDSPKIHGWQVHVRRGGKLSSKLFSDHRLGGKRKALALAKKCRAELLEKMAKYEKPLWRIKRNARTNTGELGVTQTHYFDKDGKKRKLISVTARSEVGKALNKKFSIEKLGYDDAVKQAVAWRRKVLRERLKEAKAKGLPT